MNTNIVFQISQGPKRIFKIVARLLSFTKIPSGIRFSKNSYHTENSQSISNSNQSVFSDLRSIIDLQKIHYIDFKQNQASIFFSGLGTHLNFFSLQKNWFFCIGKYLRQKKLKSYEFSFSPSNSVKINQQPIKVVHPELYVRSP